MRYPVSEIQGNSKKQFHGPQQPGLLGVKKIIQKKVAEPGKVVYSCKFCDFTFFNMKTLQDHMEKKSCQKLFKCTKCSKEFTKKPDLTNHITLIHGNVTPVVNSTNQEKTNKAIHGMFITSAKPPKRLYHHLIFFFNLIGNIKKSKECKKWNPTCPLWGLKPFFIEISNFWALADT